MKYTLTDDSERKSYFFTHNSFGDIIGIYSGSGALTAKYEYDAWGNILSITDGNGNEITDTNNIGLLNPFRYRGYYYDSDTGLYYLMSRYYDPVTRRFLNADGYFQAGGDILAANMSAYCRNNPITFIDPTGTKCSEHDPYYKPNCFTCNPSYLKTMQSKHYINWYNEINGTNYSHLTNDGIYISSCSNKISQSLSTTGQISSYSVRTHALNAAGCMVDSAADSVGIAGIGYALSTPFNIASHATNLYLTGGQKATLITTECFIAAGGIALAWGITNFWNPTGWAAIAAFAITTVYSVGTGLAMTHLSNSMVNENKIKWGGI